VKIVSENNKKGTSKIVKEEWVGKWLASLMGVKLNDY
jgi:hypothetical protein